MKERIALFFEHIWKNSLDSTIEKTLATVLGVMVLFGIRFFIIKVSKKTSPKDIIHMRWKKSTTTGFYIFSLLLISFIWIEGFKSFATLIALISAGLAIAFKEPLMNLGGWLYIISRRPFIIGDRVEIEGITGEVLDLRMFMFTLQEVGGTRVGAEQPTGRIVHIPNGKIFLLSLFNFTETTSFIFNELTLKLTADSNWKKAEEKFLEILKQHPEYWKAPQKVKSDNDHREYYLFNTNQEPEVFVKITDFGIETTLRYTVDPRKMRKVENAIWREMLDFIQNEKDIKLSYFPRRIEGMN